MPIGVGGGVRLQEPHLEGGSRVAAHTQTLVEAQRFFVPSTRRQCHLVASLLPRDFDGVLDDLAAIARLPVVAMRHDVLDDREGPPDLVKFGQTTSIAVLTALPSTSHRRIVVYSLSITLDSASAAASSDGHGGSAA